MESRAGRCFSCLYHKLKVTRDDIRRSGDAEMPESYSGSIKLRGATMSPRIKKKKKEGKGDGWFGEEVSVSEAAKPLDLRLSPQPGT